MNIVVKIVVALMIHLILFETEAQENHRITVVVQEVDNNDGQIFIGLYKTKEGFLNKMLKGATSKITDNTCTVTFDNIPDGVYAVSVFHDENDNGKMDTNFIGIPNEDYGCSNNASGFMGPPKWDDAKFELKNDKSITITL